MLPTFPLGLTSAGDAIGPVVQEELPPLIVTVVMASAPLPIDERLRFYFDLVGLCFTQ
jgi:hypothetical protein